MKIVIKIPESEIPKQQDIIEIPLHFIDGKVCEAGGYEFDVLPKGHGRLIDADNLMKVYSRFEFCSDMGDAMEILDHTPTIIEGSDSE